MIFNHITDKKRYYLPLIGIVLAIAYGCTTVPKNAVSLEIPFVAQTATNQCGATALAMAFQYYGIDYNPSNLEQEVYIPVLKGSPMILLAEAATRRNLSCTSTNLDLLGIKNTLTASNIPIIYLKPTSTHTVGHFAVVTGIDNNLKKIAIHGEAKPDLWINVRRLLKQSTHARFPTLILKPQD